MPKLRTQRWSLVLKLTAAYLAAAAAVLVGTTGVLNWTLERTLQRVELRLLDQKIDFFLQDQAAEPDDYKELFSQVSAPLRGRAPGEYWIRFLDAAGHPLAETPDMATRLPAALFGGGQAYASGRWTRRVRPPGGGVFRLVRVHSQAPGSPLREIQVALDCQRDDDLLAEYRAKLGLVVGLGLALLALASGLIARRGLEPLNTLGQLIGSQDRSSLSVPIDPSQWPPETRRVIEGYNDLSQRLHESFQRLSQFSADLAHELRTPIHNLRLQSDVILARPRRAGDYRAALESAQVEYGRLTRMTESLLFLARAEHGRQSLGRVQVLGQRELAAAAQRFAARAREQGVRLSTQGRGAFLADPSLLQLALDNLLANALTHTPRGGRVRLLCQALPGGGARIQVTDNGRGIPAEHQPKVFDRFYRGDPARSAPGGSGLGLSLVQAVMDLHGGTARVDGALAKGARITLEFPPNQPG